jgi:hypothetical protein
MKLFEPAYAGGHNVCLELRVKATVQRSLLASR